MRNTALLTCLLMVPAGAWSQDAPPAEEPPLVAPEAEPEPEPEYPALDVAPMPGANEDFTIDKERFKVIETDPEAALIEEAARQDAIALSEQPLYKRMPGLAILTQAVAGLFGAGAIGLAGGSVGEAIDPGDDSLPFGGVHGALIGGLIGSWIGATGGVWGAAHLFEKDINLGWAALGSFLGTAIGGSIAFGLVEGIDSSDGIEAIGVALMFAMQVGGAIGLSEAFLPENPGPVDTPPPVDALPGGDLSVRPTLLSIPLMQGTF